MSEPNITTTNKVNEALFNFQRNEVEKVLPEWFGESNPALINLLNAYYDWLNQQDFMEYRNLRDASIVSEQYLPFLEDELLAGTAYFDGFDDIRTALKFSNLFFKSKGTEENIKLFFKGFYNDEVTVTYPRNNLLVLEKSLPADDTYYELNKTTISILATDLLNYVMSAPIIFGADVWNQFIPMSSIRYGDIDRDGTIDASDASLLNTYANGTLTNQTAADHIQKYVLTHPKIKAYFANKTISTGTKLGEGYLVNDKKYQINSININTSLDPNVWLETYKLLIHPAGVYLSYVDPNNVGEELILIDNLEYGPVFNDRARITGGVGYALIVYA